MLKKSHSYNAFVCFVIQLFQCKMLFGRHKEVAHQILANRGPDLRHVLEAIIKALIYKTNSSRVI